MEKERDEYLENTAYQRDPNNGNIRFPKVLVKAIKKHL